MDTDSFWAAADQQRFRADVAEPSIASLDPSQNHHSIPPLIKALHHRRSIPPQAAGPDLSYRSLGVVGLAAALRVRRTPTAIAIATTAIVMSNA